MIASARLNYVRISPRKFRLIIPLIKGKKAEEAIEILHAVKKNASQHAIALITSAIANSKRVQGVDTSNLCISRLVANCGPSMKRFRAASMGRASMIKKRTSHIILELDVIKSRRQIREAATESHAKPHTEPHAKPKARASAHASDARASAQAAAKANAKAPSAKKTEEATKKEIKIKEKPARKEKPA